MMILNERGVTLTEALIAGVLLGGIIVGVMNFQSHIFKQQNDVLAKSKLVKTIKTIQADIVKSNLYILPIEPSPTQEEIINPLLTNNSPVNEDVLESLFTENPTATEPKPHTRCYNARGGIESPPPPDNANSNDLTDAQVETLKAEEKCFYLIKFFKFKVKNRMYLADTKNPGLLYLPISRLVIYVHSIEEQQEKKLFLSTIQTNVLPF